MSDRTSSSRTATLLLALSVMALSTSSVQAARIQPRDSAPHVWAIQESILIRILWQSMEDFLRAVVAHYEGPPLGQNPGHHPPANDDGASREGPGVDPHGGNHPPSNPGG